VAMTRHFRLDEQTGEMANIKVEHLLPLSVPLLNDQGKLKINNPNIIPILPNQNIFRTGIAMQDPKIMKGINCVQNRRKVTSGNRRRL